MYQDILDGPHRKIAYRIWGWLQVIVGAIAAYLTVTTEVVPKWVLGATAVITLLGSQLNFTASDNTLPGKLKVSDLKSDV